MASTAITQTVITIDGISQPITFTDLNLDERVLDTNLFSFAWTPDGNDGSLSSIVKFKDDNLSKAVTIKFNDGNGNENHVFKGVITQINSRPGSDLHVNFHISGNGMFCKINGKIECNSFYKQTLMDIINAVGSVSGASLIVNAPKDSGPQQYIVQYNQTSFDFIKMLAIRYGEWMFYDGDTLVFGGKPSSNPIKLKSGQDINNINIHAHAAKANDNAFGFDVFKGEVITGSTETAAPGSSPLLAAGGKAGGNVFTNNGTGTYYPGAATKEMLDAQNKLQQQATTASTVFISATSHNSKLTVGSVISITDQQDTSGKQFIIVEMHHAANNNHGYNNHFTAIPAEVEVPHYTNPWLFARATTQAALVVENEDKDGHDRIKVRFPWMKKTETTPWIQVLTPHAGSNKGFRWIPEKDEEVMIDFIENNAERPIMIGSIHTEKNKSGNDHTGNNMKVIGTKSGRRLEINDSDGTMRLYDNYSSKTPKNGMLFKRKDDVISMLIESQKDDQNYSVISFNNQDALNMGVVNGGELVVEIKMEKDGKKITIHSKGSIELNADDSISLNAATININASDSLKMAGTKSGVKIDGKKLEANATTDINIAATANLDLKGTMKATLEGAQAEVKGSAMVSVSAAIVKIN